MRMHSSRCGIRRRTMLSNTKYYVLKIHRNTYGQKQAGLVWNKYLVNTMVKELGFKQSKVNECVFYRGKTLYVLYTNNSLAGPPDKKEIEKVIDDLETHQGQQVGNYCGR
jgi:hypothetical protein